MSSACCASNDAISPVWRQCERCWGWSGAQSTDRLGEKRSQRAVVDEVVCVLGTTVFGRGCVFASEAPIPSMKPLWRASTRYLECGWGVDARKPALLGLVVGVSVKKFAMRGQNAPNWAILGEQGEFCPAHAVRRGVQGEFCPGSGPAWFLLGEFCSAMVPSVSPVTGLPSPTGTATRPRRPPRAFHISTDTTEAGPRRIPPLVACGGRAVGAGKPAPETQRPSLSSETTATGASRRTLSSSTSP